MENFVRFLFGITLLQIALGLQITNTDDSSQSTFTLEVEEGDNVAMKCKTMFEGGENVGTNPIKWHKSQKEDQKDDPEMGTEISNLGLMSDMFRDTSRFTVTFQLASLEETNLNLAISGVVPEDSGYYFCYSKSGGDVVFIRYKLEVSVDHTEIKLTGSSDGVNASQENALVFKENEPGSVRCEASGGYPAATLKVFIEGEDTPLTGTSRTEVELTGETEGLQTLSEKSILEIQGVTLRPEQHGKEMVCEIVSEFNTIKASRVLTVLFGPQDVKCDESVTAKKGDKNIFFGCKFAANPAPSVIIWKAGLEVINMTNINTLTQGDYTVSTRLGPVRDDGSGLSLFETKITIDEIEMEKHFQVYELDIKSDDFRNVHEEFILKIGEHGESVVGGNSASLPRVSISHLIASLVAFIVIKVSLQ